MVDTKHMQSYFMVFDAKNVEKGPVSKLLLPTYVPYGLHGCFVEGLTQDFEDITRRFIVSLLHASILLALHFGKATKALDSKLGWNEVNSGFSGLGISYDF